MRHLGKEEERNERLRRYDTIRRFKYHGNNAGVQCTNKIGQQSLAWWRGLRKNAKLKSGNARGKQTDKKALNNSLFLL